MSRRLSSATAPNNTLVTLWHYSLSLALVLIAAYAAHKSRFVLGEISPFFFLSVMLSAWFGGLGPALFATALAGWISAHYFFDNAIGWDDLLRLSIFLCAALLISFLINMRRRAEQSLRLANDHLELRVLERTRELEASNRMTRESEEGFRALIEGVTDCAICMLNPKGQVMRWNSGAEQIQGYSEAEILGRDFSIFFPRQEQQSGRPAVQLSTAATTGRHQDEGWRIRKDGSAFWSQVIISRLHDDSGALRGFAHVARDITEVKRLEQEVLEISDKEQRRIGHDLHDGLGQELTGLAFLTQNVGRKLSDKSLPEAAELQRIAKVINLAIETTRDLAMGLAPVEWGPDGLSAALQNLAIKVRDAYGIPCEFTRGRAVQVESHNAAVHLYRIAQEALGNAARHSQATRIWISFAEIAGEVVLSIEDNGIGITAANGTGKGMGLHLMPYRARSIGASFEFQSRRGGGTIVRCTYRNSVARIADAAEAHLQTNHGSA